MCLRVVYQIIIKDTLAPVDTQSKDASTISHFILMLKEEG